MRFALLAQQISFFCFSDRFQMWLRASLREQWRQFMCTLSAYFVAMYAIEDSATHWKCVYAKVWLQFIIFVEQRAASFLILSCLNCKFPIIVHGTKISGNAYNFGLIATAAQNGMLSVRSRTSARNCKKVVPKELHHIGMREKHAQKCVSPQFHENVKLKASRFRLQQ